MSDEIREAFENIESDINELMVYQTSKNAALYDLELIKNAYISQDDEISEIVEALRSLYENKSEPDKLYIQLTRQTIKDLLSRYTKAPCPECGGEGFTAEHDPSDPHIDGICTSCPIQVKCSSCQGRGYKWEKSSNC